MKLSHLTDKTLLNETKRLANSKREVTTQILHHLKEIDRRKLYSDLRCSSLFDYCVRVLGYSEGSAQRRIVAARLLAEIPSIEEKIEEGLLTLTNISQMNQFFKDSSTTEKIEVLEKIEGLSKKECEQKLFELTDKKIEPQKKSKRISKDEVQVAIVLKDETIKEIEKLKNLLGKDLSMDELIQFMAREAIKSVEKTKFKQTERPRQSPPPAAAGRVVSTAVKREVYQRDQKCSNCCTLHNLQYDHRRPWALGGKSEKENIRMLCFQCNQRARIKAGLKNGPHSRCGP